MQGANKIQNVHIEFEATVTLIHESGRSLKETPFKSNK